jgi:hypothetical protein
MLVADNPRRGLGEAHRRITLREERDVVAAAQGSGRVG